MNVLWYYLIGFIIVWVLAFLLKDKFNITIDGIVLMLKTDKLYNLIDRIANLCPRVWTFIMNIGIPVGIFFMIIMVVSLILSLQLMFETPTVSLILPGVDIPGSPLYIPFGTGLIALATVLVIHEGGHGIIARVEGVSIKSVGLLLMVIIPGAFVEPDEDEIQKLNTISKLRIYSAGPVFNIMLCIISLVLAMLIGGFIASEGVYTTDGMEIVSVVPASPAEGILTQGSVITGVNNHAVHDYNSYIDSMKGLKVGDVVSIKTESGTHDIKTSSNPNNASLAYIGIRANQHVVVTDSFASKYGTFIPWLLSELRELFNLMFLLNFAVGTFNLLPMKPLDGGLIFEELLKADITLNRRVEFNSTFNKFTKIFPMKIRCFLSRRFNSILNFLSNHKIPEKLADNIVRYTSTIFIFILVVLIVYGMLPGIIKMF
ncbi:MAG: PDZ domain-containing protein [Methanosphaera stadtmanae]|nr:PDZ domain-containing protein [Methanosphaera stadtmanae]